MPATTWEVALTGRTSCSEFSELLCASMCEMAKSVAFTTPLEQTLAAMAQPGHMEGGEAAAAALAGAQRPPPLEEPPVLVEHEAWQTKPRPQVPAVLPHCWFTADRLQSRTRHKAGSIFTSRCFFRGARETSGKAKGQAPKRKEWGRVCGDLREAFRKVPSTKQYQTLDEAHRNSTMVSKVTVSRTEERTCDVLVTFVSKVVSGEEGDAADTAFFKECKSLLDEDNRAELAQKVLGQADAIIGLDSAGEALNCFRLLNGVVCTISEAEREPVVRAYTSAVLKSGGAEPAQRLAVASALFNALGASAPERLDVYRAILRFATDSGSLASLMPHIVRVDEWLPSWHLDTEGTRELLLLLANTVREDDATNPLAHVLLVRFLATYDGGSPAELIAVKDEAALGLVCALKTPVQSFVRSELVSLSAVKQLAGDAQHGTLFAAARIFAEGRLSDLVEFNAANSGFLSKHGVDDADAMASMRLLTLCSLAAEHEEIPYASVAQALQVGEDEVETWIVRAIEAKLLTGKMDQIRQTVSVSNAAQRSYTMEQWKHMGTKLGAWTQNVRSMLGTLLAARQRATEAAQAQAAQ